MNDSRLYEKLTSICMSMVCCYFHEFFLNISFLNFFRFLAYSICIDFQIKNEKVRKQYKIGCLSYGIMFQGGTCNCKGSIGFFLLNKNLKKKKKKTLCLIYSSQLEHSFISFSIHFKEKKIIIFILKLELHLSILPGSGRRGRNTRECGNVSRACSLRRAAPCIHFNVRFGVAVTLHLPYIIH